MRSHRIFLHQEVTGWALFLETPLLKHGKNEVSAFFFSVKGQIINILDFVGDTDSVTCIYICLIAQKQPWTMCEQMDMVVFQKNLIYRNKLWAGFGLRGQSLLTPWIRRR